MRIYVFDFPFPILPMVILSNLVKPSFGIYSVIVSILMTLPTDCSVTSFSFSNFFPSEIVVTLFLIDSGYFVFNLLSFLLVKHEFCSKHSDRVIKTQEAKDIRASVSSRFLLAPSLSRVLCPAGSRLFAVCLAATEWPSWGFPWVFSFEDRSWQQEMFSNPVCSVLQVQDITAEWKKPLGSIIRPGREAKFQTYPSVYPEQVTTLCLKCTD